MKQVFSAENRIGTMRVQMLGGFSVYVDDIQVVSSEAGGQVWNLMSYLLHARKKTLTQQQLIGALWDDSVDDPSAALKNLIYRLRKAFADAGVPNARRVVLSGGGTYRWNNDIPIRVDTEVFEAACAAADEADTQTEQMRLDQLALDCYPGDFLPGVTARAWAVPVRSQYHARYFQTLYRLLTACEATGRWQQMQDAALRAVEVDRFEEETHRYLMLALFHLGRQDQAITHYNYISDLFYRERGTDLSPELRATLRQIAETVKSGSSNLTLLKEELREDSLPDGAYYCEYEIFKSMCRVQARSAQRDGIPVFLGLLTISAPTGGEPENNARNAAMQALHRAVAGSLRVGDVFSRCTGTQYIVMLPDITYENGERVLGRIARRFKSSYHSRKISLSSNLQPMDPVAAE